MYNESNSLNNPRQIDILLKSINMICLEFLPYQLPSNIHSKTFQNGKI